MSDRLPEQKARNTTRTDSFNAGRSLSAPGTSQAAGGANLKKPFPTQTGGTAFNEGRSRLATPVERHYNKGTASIKAGNAGVPPR